MVPRCRVCGRIIWPWQAESIFSRAEHNDCEFRAWVAVHDSLPLEQFLKQYPGAKEEE